MSEGSNGATGASGTATSSGHGSSGPGGALGGPQNGPSQDEQGRPPEGNGPAQGSGETTVSPAEEWLANKRKLKINGSEREVTAKEAFESYQLKQASFETFEKAKKLEKALEQRERQLMEFAKNNPAEFMRRLHGPDRTRQIMEHEVTQALQYDMMKPEQKAHIQLEQQRQQLEQQRRQFQQEQHQYQAHQLQSNYEQSFPQALQAAGVEPTKGNVREMAAMARRMLDAGVQWTPELAAQAVADAQAEREQEFVGRRKAKLANMTEEQLFEVLNSEYGEEILNKFRKADVNRLKVRPSQPQPGEQPQDHTQRQQQKAKFMSIEQLREEFERRRG